MEKRLNGRNSDSISLLGFGCMRFPETNRLTKKINRAEALKLVDYAYKNGVNYFDTAYIYHFGKSETFIGEALSRFPRSSFFLADKIPTWLIRSQADVAKYFDKQLDKCGVDYFDYYLVHCLNVGNYKKMVKHNIYQQLCQLKQQGKIRNLGFSFHDKPELLQEIVANYDWDFAQIQLNYLDWEVQNAKKQYEILAEKNIPVIVMEPVRGGLLATLNPQTVGIFKQANPDASVASWALRYAASFDNVITVLSGMTTMEHVVDNINTFSDFKPLSLNERQVINKALNNYKKVTTIFCTACGYCLDCPQKINIPAAFNLYNRYVDGMDAQHFAEEINCLNPPLTSCLGCNKCQEHCPQHIRIPEQLKHIAKTAAEVK